jgi:hypothetical protein
MSQFILTWCKIQDVYYKHENITHRNLNSKELSNKIAFHFKQQNYQYKSSTQL